MIVGDDRLDAPTATRPAPSPLEFAGREDGLRHWFRAALQAAGLTPWSASEAAGHHPNHLGQFLRRGASMGRKTSDHYADLFGVSRDDLWQIRPRRAPRWRPSSEEARRMQAGSVEARKARGSWYASEYTRDAFVERAREMGRKAGQTTLERHGREHFVAISQTGVAIHARETREVACFGCGVVFREQAHRRRQHLRPFHDQSCYLEWRRRPEVSAFLGGFISAARRYGWLKQVAIPAGDTAAKLRALGLRAAQVKEERLRDRVLRRVESALAKLAGARPSWVKGPGGRVSTLDEEIDHYLDQAVRAARLRAAGLKKRQIADELGLRTYVNDAGVRVSREVDDLVKLGEVLQATQFPRRQVLSHELGA